MGLSRLSFIFLLIFPIYASEVASFECEPEICFTTPITNASFPPEMEGQMLYFIHHGQATQAFDLYLQNVIQTGKHDFALLQKAAIRLLEQGMQSHDPEIELLCMFGAGISLAPSLLPILEKGVHSKELKTQLIALNFLGRMQDDEADLLLMSALSSPFLITRLEACFELAKKEHSDILAQLQSLFVKIPPIIRPLFPQIVVHVDSIGATQMMRQLLSDGDVNVRVEAILAAAKAKRDDFLPQIRSLAMQVHHAQQESSACALGELGDLNAFEILQTLSNSKRDVVRIAAARSLYKLGEKEALQIILDEAVKDNLFAIAVLGTIREKRVADFLAPLLHSEDRDIRLNTVYSLLRLGDRRALANIEEFLIPSQKDFGFTHSKSPGGGLTAWKTIPSRMQNTKNYPNLIQETHEFRAQLLLMSLELCEDDFLNVAKMVFERAQSDLIPVLVELLINHRTVGVLDLLKEQQIRAGAPLIRNYCNLALFRLNEEGPYEANLLRWVKDEQKEEMIRFRDEPSEDRHMKWVLSPEERSQLLISSYEALATAQNHIGIEALIRAIAYGNSKNRYALAGLLMRTTE